MMEKLSKFKELGLSEKALIAGDRASAADHKRAQILSTHLYRAAVSARKDIEKMTRWIKRFVEVLVVST